MSAGVSQRTAEKAIAWLRKVGLLTTKRNYRPDGSIAGCAYWLRNTPPGQMDGTLPASSTAPSRPDGRSNNRPREQTNSTDHRSDQSSTASDRCAPSSGGERIPNQRKPWTDLDDDSGSVSFEEITNEDASPTKNLTEARSRDREIFHEVVGDKLHTDGSTFGPEGVYRWDQFYVALRKWERKRPITWPGRLIEAISGESPDGSADDYLISIGLERA